MATEVSCGQCQGRLLVETLGVVVACPHCGTHLSIPAPEPAPEPAPVAPPAPAPEPVPVPAPVPPPPEAVTFEQAPTAPPAPVEAVSQGVASIAADVSGGDSAPAPADDPNSASVFSGVEEHPTNIGWHSAPNLFLTPEPASSVSASPPALFTSPLMDRDPTHAPAAEGAEFTFAAAPAPTVPEVTFAAAPAPSVPEVTFAAAPSPVAVDAEHLVSASQPLSLSAVEAAVAAAAPVQFTAPAPNPPVFGAAPDAPAPVPFTFGATPTVVPPVSAPAPLTFGAAPAPVAAPTAVTSAPPLTFGAASPAAQNIAPVPALKANSVAEDAAAFAENELQSRQKFLFMMLVIVGSYASAITIVLVYTLLFSRTSNLESLPDLVPPKTKKGDITWNYNPPKNEVAPGHTLTLGQSRRFGNVKVTPIGVTRGTVRFEHFSGQAGLERSPSEPILKLWVKFENVSRNQTFAPLDPHMLFTRDSRNMGQSVRANSFIALTANRVKNKADAYIFDLPVQSEFRMVGQSLGRELDPGENLETFVPSDEEARNLNGELVWRFQFRKGYHPKSMRGVTTLIDVRFNSKDIKNESA